MLVDALKTTTTYQQRRSPSVHPLGTMGKHPIYGAIIKCQATGRYLLVCGRRANKWSLPKGHADYGESPFECLVREVYEETGYLHLPNPLRSVTLRVGVYYEFEVPEEFQTAPIDTNEVSECRWVTVDEARALDMNIDANAYFRSLTI
jgi:8-oxo-dGTP pyrophosphatase MutT (NUDIX family)